MGSLWRAEFDARRYLLKPVRPSDSTISGLKPNLSEYVGTIATLGQKWIAIRANVLSLAALEVT